MFGLFGQSRSTPTVMTTSDAGIEFISRWEGIERLGGRSRFAPRDANLRTEQPSKYYVYLDPINLPTIGIGHLLTREELSSGTIVLNGRSVNYRNGLTRQEVFDLKRQDNKRFEDAIHRHIKVPLTQLQFDALVSWSFNVGAGRLDPKNQTLARKLNARDYRGAADEFLKWNRAGGKVLAGLTNRRKAERDMFLRGTK